MTLVEKLIVCFLIGILSAIGVPTWGGFVAAQEIKVTGNQVQDAIASAKSEARLKKLLSDYLFRSCQTATTCNIADQMDTATMNELESSMRSLPSDGHSSRAVQFHNYLQSISVVQLQNLITSDLRPILAQSALIQNGQVITPASSLVPYSVSPAGKQTKDASQKDAKRHRGDGRREDKATKKPAKNKLVVTGCFQSNGLFLMSSGSSFTQVNWTTLPANTTINVKAPLCQGSGVSQ